MWFSHSAIRNNRDSVFVFNLGFVKWPKAICSVVNIIALNNFRYSVNQKKKESVYDHSFTKHCAQWDVT